MAESIQHKLDRIRPPRVQITYDVEIGGAIEMKEIPFVLGIMADLSGMPGTPLPKLKDRKFVEIDRDNFNDIMESIHPRLALRVINTLVPPEVNQETGESTFTETNVELHFKNMDDFLPLNIVKNVPSLAKLYSIRSHIKDLLTKLDGNDDLEALLKQLMTDTAMKDEVKAALPAQEDSEGNKEEPNENKEEKKAKK